jgi:type I restriction enzyme, S subunit
MNEWEVKRLDDVADRIAVKNSAGHQRVLTVAAGHGLVDQETYFNKRVASADLSGYWVVEPGDFVYNKSTSKDAPWGVIARWDGDEPAVVTTLYIVFRARPNIESDYLLHACNGTYFFNSLRGTLREGARAHGLLNVRLAEFFGAQLVVPPHAEQRRIVDVMEAVDAQIVALAGEAKAARVLLRARRSDLLIRESATIPVKRAFSVLMGRQRAPQHAIGPYMTNYLRSANIGDGVLDLADIKQMNFNPDERAKFGLRVGDVLVSEGSASAAAVGLSAVWHGEVEDPICFQKTLLRFRAIDGVSTAAFTNHWCQWAFESGTFLKISSGTNIKHITAVRVLEVPVALPGIEEQSTIADELDRLKAQHTAVRDELAHLRSFRSVLLASLLSGGIEIPESYDALLEKVS